MGWKGYRALDEKCKSVRFTRVLHSRPREELDGFGDYGRRLRDGMPGSESRLHVRAPRCSQNRDGTVDLL